ncbi:glutathione ABC transporter substrate-binding protein [Lentibacillus sp. CBA3610]|uniref:glutathione ABC transporter substrate-binding protein n=1 Tax=Lentibacillus sp. CBA3610 TaxID=2518176 RepID=UPI00159517EA|nr:glutathione ABC transporter substrate-binding protein [Lentibacillus sp. CBA3610]QKY70573.1 glutathione ABC transporter substrate-binding protein [Lentibacillus sp. CBA3610]
MKSGKFIWVFSFLLVITLGLSACAGDGERDEGANETGADAGSASGGDLTIAIGSDVVTLSPHGANDIPSSNVHENIYETLTVMDENGEIGPGLAEEWEEVDGTTWDFHLREGVTFHDGAELTADVVKMNFDRLMDEAIGSPRAFLVEAVESVEVQDDYTVRFNLKYPYSPLLAHLAHNGTSIMSPNVIEEDYAQMEEGGDVDAHINQNPVGTGPFKFEEWTPGESVVVTRYEDYWGENAKLGSATFKVVEEQSTRLAELETGTSDVAAAVGPDNISRVEGMANANLLQEPSISLSYIGFNTQKEPFDDKRVRQAVSMAVDKDEIIEGVYNGVGTPAPRPLAPSVFGYDDSVEGLEYDPEQAQELLAEAGYEDGFETTIWTNDSEQRVDTAVTVQSQLADIGIDVEIEELEWGAYLERTANGEHDMFVLGWSNSTADADYGMYPLFHSSQQGDPGNRSFIDNQELDELLEQARQETDPEARQELYSQAQELLVEQAPMIYVHHKEFLLGVDDSVKDFGIDVQGHYQIKDAYIEQ